MSVTKRGSVGAECECKIWSKKGRVTRDALYERAHIVSVFFFSKTAFVFLKTSHFDKNNICGRGAKI